MLGRIKKYILHIRKTPVPDKIALGRYGKIRKLDDRLSINISLSAFISFVRLLFSKRVLTSSSRLIKRATVIIKKYLALLFIVVKLVSIFLRNILEPYDLFAEMVFF